MELPTRLKTASPGFDYRGMLNGVQNALDQSPRTEMTRILSSVAAYFTTRDGFLAVFGGSGKTYLNAMQRAAEGGPCSASEEERTPRTVDRTCADGTQKYSTLFAGVWDFVQPHVVELPYTFVETNVKGVTAVETLYHARTPIAWMWEEYDREMQGSTCRVEYAAFYDYFAQKDNLKFQSAMSCVCKDCGTAQLLIEEWVETFLDKRIPQGAEAFRESGGGFLFYMRYMYDLPKTLDPDGSAQRRPAMIGLPDPTATQPAAAAVMPAMAGIAPPLVLKHTSVMAGKFVPNVAWDKATHCEQQQQQQPAAAAAAGAVDHQHGRSFGGKPYTTHDALSANPPAGTSQVHVVPLFADGQASAVLSFSFGLGLQHRRVKADRSDSLSPGGSLTKHVEDTIATAPAHLTSLFSDAAAVRDLQKSATTAEDAFEALRRVHPDLVGEVRPRVWPTPGAAAAPVTLSGPIRSAGFDALLGKAVGALGEYTTPATLVVTGRRLASRHKFEELSVVVNISPAGFAFVTDFTAVNDLDLGAPGKAVTVSFEGGVPGALPYAASWLRTRFVNWNDSPLRGGVAESARDSATINFVLFSQGPAHSRGGYSPHTLSIVNGANNPQNPKIGDLSLSVDITGTATTLLVAERFRVAESFLQGAKTQLEQSQGDTTFAEGTIQLEIDRLGTIRETLGIPERHSGTDVTIGVNWIIHKAVDAMQQGAFSAHKEHVRKNPGIAVMVLDCASARAAAPLASHAVLTPPPLQTSKTCLSAAAFALADTHPSPPPPPPPPPPPVWRLGHGKRCRCGERCVAPSLSALTQPHHHHHH